MGSMGQAMTRKELRERDVQGVDRLGQGVERVWPV